MIFLFWDFTGEYGYWLYDKSDLPEPSRIKKKKANIFIKVKWFMLIQMWKINHRRWTKCRHKTKALNKYKS